MDIPWVKRTEYTVGTARSERRQWACLLLAALLLCAAGPARAKAPKLPIDLSGGKPLSESGFGEGWTYEDPTIRVSVTQSRWRSCDYWVADIVIGDASQLRTAPADTFQSGMRVNGERMARRVNAALAINGDYFCYTGIGYIVRQGVTYLNTLWANRDVLAIDEDGDFHVFPLAKKNSINGTVKGKKIINAFFFGPLLVQDGKRVVYIDGVGMAQDEPRQRMAIAQAGPLHYKCICCATHARGSRGLTLDQFATLVAKQGVQTAYNLDGGNSCMMIFAGEKINDRDNPDTRDICDIIYFASAWPGDQP